MIFRVLFFVARTAVYLALSSCTSHGLCEQSFRHIHVTSLLLAVSLESSGFLHENIVLLVVYYGFSTAFSFSSSGRATFFPFLVYWLFRRCLSSSVFPSSCPSLSSRFGFMPTCLSPRLLVVCEEYFLLGFTVCGFCREMCFAWNMNRFSCVPS